MDADVLKNSFIRSLSRKQEKARLSTDVKKFQQDQRKFRRLERKCRENHGQVLQYQHALREVCERQDLDC